MKNKIRTKTYLLINLQYRAVDYMTQRQSLCRLFWTPYEIVRSPEDVFVKLKTRLKKLTLDNPTV